MTWRSGEWAAQRRRLFAARAERVQPGRDEKILTSWNGMMLRAFATAAWVFDDTRYAAAGRANARFVREHLYRDGRLLRSYKDGQAKLNGYLEDYANYVDGLLALYGATFEPEWLRLARDLAATMTAEFHEAGAFYDTGRGHEPLITRPRDAFDGATPSGNSVACDVLLRLGHLTGDIDFTRVAQDVLRGYGPLAAEQPHGFARALCAIDFAVGPSAELAVIGDPAAPDTRAMLAAAREHYLPRSVAAVAAPAEADGLAALIPFLAGRPQADDRATAFVCLNYACQLPTTNPATMVEQLRTVMRDA
jgi:uncharacterized protein YyaL (SSP411 family)